MWQPHQEFPSEVLGSQLEDPNPVERMQCGQDSGAGEGALQQLSLRASSPQPGHPVSISEAAAQRGESLAQGHTAAESLNSGLFASETQLSPWLCALGIGICFHLCCWQGLPYCGWQGLTWGWGALCHFPKSSFSQTRDFQILALAV